MGLGGDERARARELDLLRFQIEEIDAAGVHDPGEDVTLEAEEALLADAAAHRDALGNAVPGARGGHRWRRTGGRRRPPKTGRRSADLVERLRGAQAEVGEVERELRLASEAIPDDPGRLDEIRGRRRALRELQRKYGDTLGEVVAFGELTRRRVAELEGYEVRAGSSKRTGAPRMPRRRRARPRCPRPDGPPRARWGRRSPGICGSWRCPTRSSPSTCPRRV